MTIEEAIAQAEAIEIKCELYKNKDASSGVVWETRRALAAQLAEWLKELLELREGIHHKCKGCKRYGILDVNCVMCGRAYPDQYERG